MTNFAGAFDLSRLGQKNQPAQQAATAGLEGWLVKADEQVLRKYLQISEKTPVLMLISDQSETSNEVRVMAERAIVASEGRFAGLEIDITTSPQLAQAVGVASAPAMLAILAGQPAPLFQGKPTSEQLLQVLAQVLQLAQQNGITQRVQVGAVTDVEPELSPAHQDAISDIEAGNLASAKAKYEKLLVEYPNDKDALAGLNQVKLMLRSQTAPEGDLEQKMAIADKLLVSGDPAAAFSALLDLYEGESKDQIRARLLELFSLVGESDQSVLEARRRLASLMF